MLPVGNAGMKSVPAGVDISKDLVRKRAPPLVDTADPDPEIPCEFFDSRQSFLHLCQGNHYQFDTLRRAKHSSMMVLYHLHNPEEPAFVSQCNVCGGEMEPGKGWRCTVCKDFDMCDYCKNHAPHPHPMLPASRASGTSLVISNHQSENNQQRKEKLQVREGACAWRWNGR